MPAVLSNPRRRPLLAGTFQHTQLDGKAFHARQPPVTDM
jgi:hypothetical protein